MSINRQCDIEGADVNLKEKSPPKMECQEERARELQLRRDADEKNMKLSVVEKQSKTWKVIGGRGERRVALLPM